jgi:hypothetical protein
LSTIFNILHCVTIFNILHCIVWPS